MNKALKFRRKLAWTWAGMALVLLAVFYLAVRGGGEAIALDGGVAHTQEVLGVIGDARLERARLANQWLTNQLARNGGRTGGLDAPSSKLREDVARLRTLTADNPAQQDLIAELQEVFDKELTPASSQSSAGGTAGSANPAPWAETTETTARLRALFDHLEANERALLAARSRAVQANARVTRIVVVFAGSLTLLILGAAGYFIQREILNRGRIETGLRKAQELLGVKYEDQRQELGHAMDDLHGQIRARQQAEGEIRLLNIELEDRVEKRTKELQDANQELEAFSYSVSHDLRAPLRHMDGFSHILQQEYGAQLPEEARHYLDRVRSATTHMSSLVEDLLQLSRLGRQSPQLCRVALRTLMEEAQAETLSAAGNRDIEWRIRDLPEAEVDANLFPQVWVNLLSNAIKFSRNQSKAVIEIGSLEEKGETILFVRDNGAGFDPRYADKLFGVFQRLHRQDEFEGTGIGLATIHRILKKHGCRVWAESQPGQGATFYFTVPTVIPSSETHETIGART
jgi:signal transduction histidine kinase